MKIEISTSIKLKEGYSDYSQLITQSNLIGEDIRSTNEFITKDVSYRLISVDRVNAILLVPINILSLFGVTAEQVSMIDIHIEDIDILYKNDNKPSFELKLTSTLEPDEVEDIDESLSTSDSTSESISESGLTPVEPVYIPTYITASRFMIANVKEFYNEIYITKLNIPEILGVEDTVCSLRIVLTRK